MANDSSELRRARNRQKSAEKREANPDAITCPLCEFQIQKYGETLKGDKKPYRAMSLITHYKQYHETNSLGIDKILSVPPGTTPVCSPALINKVFKPAGSRGATALAAKMTLTGKKSGKKVSMADLEDEAIASGIGDE